MSVNADGQGKKLTRHILARLESDVSGRAWDPDTDPGTVEHILPENPSAQWEIDFPREYWDRSIYRIGNLSLLEASFNRQVGNADFAEKCGAYARSRYELSRRLPDEAGETWTPEKLNARQVRLAARAVHLWRVDYPG